jgi:hypothetical protein
MNGERDVYTQRHIASRGRPQTAAACGAYLPAGLPETYEIADATCPRCVRRVMDRAIERLLELARDGK